MYIVPVLYTARPGTDLKQIWLFLERNGTHLIELDDGEPVKAAKEFLETNGMTAAAEPIVVGDMVFMGIDPTSNDINSFYTWKEVPAGTIPSKEVWRSFLWLSANGVDPLGVNRLLDTITLSDKHTVFSVLSSYLKT